MKRFFFGLPVAARFVLFVFLSSVVGSSEAIAQVIPDRTLPTNSRVNQNGNIIQIDDGTTAGSNLFHSFDQFSLTTGTTAHFNNATNIQNIFSRVTGRSISNIDGTIQANGTANLFLLNPNGILFGPNAALNIGGSFFASTGDRLLFSDGTSFSASEPQTSPLLTISVPIGLGFGANPGSIVNQSQITSPGFQGPTRTGLQVAAGQTLSLIGGDILLDGGDLTAAGGQIELGSVGANSQVNLIPFGSSFQLGYPNGTAFGDIRLTDLAEVNTSGVGGGEIRVQGRNVILTGGAGINSNTLGALPGSPIIIDADESLQVLGATNRPGVYETALLPFDIRVPYRSVINSSTLGAGDAGPINITTRRLIASDGGRISSGSTFTATGDGATLTVNASDYVEVSGGVTVEGNGSNPLLPGRLGVELNGISSLSTIAAALSLEGDAGNIVINTDRLLVDRGGVITSNTFIGARGGQTTINAREVEVRGANSTGVVRSVITSSSITTGPAGDLTVNADRILLRQGGSIGSNILGTGRGGTLMVNARESIDIRGDGDSNTGLLANTTRGGEAGDLIVNTARLTVVDGGTISVSGGPSGIAGDLRVISRDVVLDNQARLTAETNTGRGGNIHLGIRNSLQLTRGSQISASTVSGSGGNLTIDARGIGQQQTTIEPTNLIRLSGGSRLSVTATDTGDAGSAAIAVRQLVLDDVPESSNPTGIFASSVFGLGGDITLQGIEGLNLTNSRISASTQTGRGGSLDIGATGGEILLNGTGGLFVEATETGSAGNIEVNAQQLTLQNGARISAANRSFLPTASTARNFGNIRLHGLETLTVNNSQITASTQTGRAGSLTVDAADTVQLNGTGELAVEATGNNGIAGDLRIRTGRLRVNDGASVTVSGRRGQAGNLVVAADQIRLDRGALDAETAATGANQANIQLRGLNFLILRNGSQISTRAFSDGNGGNIEIDAGGGYVVAVPNEDSDIIANAFQGRGGNINISTQGIFGLIENDQDTFRSEINASSQIGVDGEIEITTLDVDPNRGLVELPTGIVDVSRQIAQDCSARGTAVARNRGEFLITGRGGLPPSPTDPLIGEAIIVDWESPLAEEMTDSTHTVFSTAATTRPSEPIVEAQGWAMGADGNVMLIAQASHATPYAPPDNAATCSGE
ncbi:MAG: filamentous hemagglutinin N-terminal domain-containing protein [Oculatellaceae cyanobacterium bins.114]|nr:filamentous hemagglutinin N-terminal domain-containing protein [Oculatellaceae cyanobacterium bins.114]